MSESRIDAAIAEYLQAVEAGTPPEREAWLTKYADLRTELERFLADQSAFRRAAEPLDPDKTMAPLDAAISDPMTVRYFGDYELQSEIARGGMGVVWRARQVSLNRPVALKMILSGQLAGPAEVQRFRTEAEAAANLDHPNILPIYEVGEHEGQQYFSMKLIDGGSLADAIRNKPLSERKAVELLANVCRAVHFAHQRGILHRDLKPANVLLDREGMPYVTDFGLAKKIESDSALTHTGAIIGTPSYMAPEQARASKMLTTAVDVYALGAILYEMLTGQPPFRAGTTVDTILQVLEKEPVNPRSLNPRAHRDLCAISLRCLTKDPQGRYESAAALADDLERWAKGEPTLARPPSLAGLAWRWLRRNAAGAAAVLLVALIWGVTVVVAVAAVARRYDTRFWPHSFIHPLAWARYAAEDRIVEFGISTVGIMLTFTAGWLVNRVARPRDTRAAVTTAAVTGLIAAAAAFLYLVPFAANEFADYDERLALHPIRPTGGSPLLFIEEKTGKPVGDTAYLTRFLAQESDSGRPSSGDLERLRSQAIAANRLDMGFKVLWPLAALILTCFLPVAAVSGWAADYLWRSRGRRLGNVPLYLELFFAMGLFIELAVLITLFAGIALWVERATIYLGPELLMFLGVIVLLLGLLSVFQVRGVLRHWPSWVRILLWLCWLGVLSVPPLLLILLRA
jgi:hypothetical protein